MTHFERREADWLDPRRALGRILAAVPALRREHVALEAAIGRALAEDVLAGATLPPWHNSAMDGYAVRAADVEGASPERPRELRVVGVVRAGEVSERMSVASGQAARIMTGGPLPRGADTVVRVEDTDAEAGETGRVAVLTAIACGRNVRSAGEDVREGDVVLRSGAAIGPGQVAALAAAGRERVCVGARPEVAVLCSGDELRSAATIGDVAAGHGVPDSNGPMLVAALAACGARPLPLGVAPDRPDAISERVERALEADALITVGGASMGEADLFKRVLDGLGFQLDFWRLRLRPGTPFSFGHLPRAGRSPLPIFGLPGNPASAFVTFHLLVRPFLLRAAGHATVHLSAVDALAGDTLAGGGSSARAWRVRLERERGHTVARPAGPQGSGLVLPLARADALVIVPAGREVHEGEDVQAFVLGHGVAASDVSPFGPAGEA